MKTMTGAMGWAALTASLVGLGGCDDTKATCEKICDKMGECVPAQVDAATKSPGSAGDEADEQTDECKATCAKDEEVTDAEKEKFAKAKQCLDKDCNEFIACIEKL